MDAVDSEIPDPTRALDRPFLMPVEDVFSIPGRGTVATGRIESGMIKAGEEVEIVGLKPTAKTSVTGAWRLLARCACRDCVRVRLACNTAQGCVSMCMTTMRCAPNRMHVDQPHRACCCMNP